MALRTEPNKLGTTIVAKYPTYDDLMVISIMLSVAVMLYVCSFQLM